MHAIPIADGLALYCEGSAQLHVLNPTGRILWRELAAGRTLAFAARKIARQFGAPLKQVLDDCRKTASAFQKMLRPSQIATVPVEPMARLPLAQRHLATGASGEWRCRIAGQVFSLRTTAELWPKLQAVVGHLHYSGDSAAARFVEIVPVSDGFVLNVDAHERARSKTLSGLQYRLLQALAGFAFEQPGRLALLHAGAVLRGDRCLVFPARGGSGKTTLVTGLMHAGHALLADDVLAVDAATLEVLPLPLPLSIKQGSWEVVGARYPELMENPVLAVGPKRLRLLPPALPVDGIWERGHRAACLINPVYRPGETAQLTPCSRWEMLQIMFDARSVICLPDPLRLRKLLRWVGGLPAYRLAYGNLDEAIGLLNRLELQ